MKMLYVVIREFSDGAVESSTVCFDHEIANSPESWADTLRSERSIIAETTDKSNPLVARRFGVLEFYVPEHRIESALVRAMRERT